MSILEANFNDAKDRALKQIHEHTLSAIEAERMRVFESRGGPGGFISARVDGTEVQLTPPGSLGALADRIKP